MCSCHNIAEMLQKLALNINQSIASYITTKVVNSNPTHGKVYSVQFYVINLSVTCSRSVVFFGFPPPIKLKCKNITEILLKVVLHIHNVT